jgi:drug/metabolite transporter (DMT)-like permease
VYSSATLTALLGWWFLKEGLNWAKILAIFLSLGGCVLVSGTLRSQTTSVNMMGVSIGILSGLAFAVYTLMGRSAWQRGLNPWITLLYTFGFAAVLLLIFNLLPLDPLPGKAAVPSDLFWPGSALRGWVVLFLLAAGPTLTGFGLYNVSLSYLPSSVVNLIVTLEPVFTAILAYFFLGEIMTNIQTVGSILILTSVVFLRLFGSRKNKQMESFSS